MHEATTDTADTATRTPARVPLFWTSAAVIGCLLVSAGRRTVSGLALDLSYRALTGEFGRGRVARYEDIDFPPALTHEPTRRFLSETGLPDDAFPLAADDDGIPLPTLAEHYGDGALGEAAGHLVRLGRLPDGSDVVVDGATGTVLTWHPCETRLRPLTPDVSTLVFTLWLLRRAAAMETVGGNEPT
ncbi:SUKH-4 family immunity protein [Streptomyces sp. Babs14]|uniref:SUKH-4 family immunity protein n=1 Tax=unclassified Streptomyces TaxID=2593676 RepID=UPI001C23CA95|nr:MULTISPECIES: SUKH-4 family immunity protein [unclassified Streptomyces]MBU8550030.1 SUKH-4 family immunity protein [Streptomyces sp. Osf17]MBU8556810.1 SUKH-4 family immunity protein [Streptomyces sp. Babs14]